MYYLVLIEIVLAFFLLFLIWQGIGYIKKQRLWQKISRTPFPEKYRRYLEHIPHYQRLPDTMKREIERSILFFMETKEFRTVDIVLTDEMKAVIAFYACLMQLGKKECYENLNTIIIYPNDVITERVRANGGIYAKEAFVLEGESAGGTVVIAWHEAKKEAYHPHNHNVIVHELAHELDYEDGVADGVPPIGYSRYKEWAEVMFGTYDRLKEAFEKGRYLEKYKLIGEYAATNEAEFFAVVCELFFEKPLTLKKHFPDIYRELYAFYGLDTALLFGRL